MIVHEFGLLMSILYDAQYESVFISFSSYKKCASDNFAVRR